MRQCEYGMQNLVIASVLYGEHILVDVDDDGCMIFFLVYRAIHFLNTHCSMYVCALSSYKKHY